MTSPPDDKRPVRASPRPGPEAEDDRLARLPRWAQEEITHLRRALTEAREERNEALKAPVSNTAYLRSAGAVGGDGPREVYLPDGAVVRFYLDRTDGKAPRERASVDVNVVIDPHRSPRLRIGSATGQVMVLPQACNAFHVCEVHDAP